jgi:hypothetical protein
VGTKWCTRSRMKTPDPAVSVHQGRAHAFHNISRIHFNSSFLLSCTFPVYPMAREKQTASVESLQPPHCAPRGLRSLVIEWIRNHPLEFYDGMSDPQPACLILSLSFRPLRAKRGNEEDQKAEVAVEHRRCWKRFWIGDHIFNSQGPGCRNTLGTAKLPGLSQACVVSHLRWMTW